MNIMSSLQRIGKSLMLPIASLPVAGLLLRFGQEDLLNLAAMVKAGNAIFSNLPLIFAAGVAIGFSERNKATAAFAGLVAFLIFRDSLSTFTYEVLENKDGILSKINKPVDMAVLGGIIIGVLAGLMSDRAVNWKLPEFLGFFSGARLVPIVSGVIAFILAFLFGHIWPSIQHGLDSVGGWIGDSGWLGAAVYGFLNRVLIITGLHHVVNSFIWFLWQIPGSSIVGDLNRFTLGDPKGGWFTAGFYPICLFGLPAAAAAMVVCAKPEKRKATASIMASVAFTSFLTGVTEPIEFSFMLIAPILYLIHALMTAISLAISAYLDIHLGFTFSAGLIDYLLLYSMPAQKNALLLIPLGLLFAVIYFLLFVTAIRAFNIKTPGREDEDIFEGETSSSGDDSYEVIVNALGGINNVISVDFCITRLRLELKDVTLINQEILKKNGAKGVIFPGGTAAQVIFGPKAEKIAEYMMPLLGKLEA